jgi:hypothetical protein
VRLDRFGRVETRITAVRGESQPGRNHAHAQIRCTSALVVLDAELVGRGVLQIDPVCPLTRIRQSARVRHVSGMFAAALLDRGFVRVCLTVEFLQCESVIIVS